MPSEAREVIPELPSLYDEPFADSSQIPTYLVARLARQCVTVSLSGDGADELLGGYNRYLWAARIWRHLRMMPHSFRARVGAGVVAVTPQAWTALVGRLRYLLPRAWRYANPGDKLHKIGEILGSRSAEEVYLGLVSLWRSPGEIVVGGREPATVLTERQEWAGGEEFEHRMMFLDMVTYLPDDILVKVDRAAMAVSLETRVPFLDHRVVEFAWRLPLCFKFQDGVGKWLLRQVLYKHVPAALVDRPKMGFGIPLDIWLRGPLRAWAEDLLDPVRLRREGFLRPEAVERSWREHLGERRNWAHRLWHVLMFQAWLNAQ